MSVTLSGRMSGPAPAGSARRVRHDVRDGIAVIAFSATSSTVLALTLLLLTRLAG